MTRQELYQRAWQCFRQGNLKRAVELSQRLVSQFPQFAEGWRLSSLVASATRDYETAVKYARRAVDLEPLSPMLLAHLSQCLLESGLSEDAIRMAERALAQRPKEGHVYDVLGNVFSQYGDQERALKLFRKATAKEPNQPTFLFNLATTLRFIGDLEGAERAYDKVIRQRPDDCEAYKNRSDIRRQTRDSNHIKELKEALDSKLKTWRGDMQLCYALAKELEDIGDYKASFSYLRRGSDLRHTHMQYDVERDLQSMSLIAECFDDNRMRAAPVGYLCEEPIFVVGMPRTGSTLVERILSSHPDIFAVGELQNFSLQLTKLVWDSTKSTPTDRANFIAETLLIDHTALGRAYIESTRPRTGHTKFFIDKMPLNFLYLGLIHLALPQAKIVHVMREPMDSCYAAYKTLFRDAYPFSYDLNELARYYISYWTLMRHWKECLSGKIYEIKYENLVRNPEKETRKLLSYCGIPFDEACLRFYESSEPSTTASASQIREPIYTSSIGLWRNHQYELTPVREALTDAGIIS